MVKYTKKGIIGSVTILTFLVSSFLVFFIQPWIVLVVNGVEMLLFGLIFRYTRIPRAVFFIGILIYLAFAAIVILFPLNVCHGMIEYISTKNPNESRLNQLIWDYRLFMIIVSALTLLFTGFVFYVNFFDSDVGYDEYPEDVSLTGVLGSVGGILIMLSWISGALSSGDTPLLLAPLFFAALHSALTWFIKCLMRGWVRECISVRKPEYDIYSISESKEYSSKSNSKYRVTDEKGVSHTLTYSGGVEAVDETGAVWITQNGGYSFRKQGLYIYTDPDGNKEYLIAPYATLGETWPSHLVDKNGKSYSVSGYGELKEDRLSNYDDGSPRETIETYRLSHSEERVAERISDDD